MISISKSLGPVDTIPYIKQRETFNDVMTLRLERLEAPLVRRCARPNHMRPEKQRTFPSEGQSQREM